MPTILFIPRTPLPSFRRISSSKPVACPDCGTPFDGQSRACSGCGRVIERAVVPASPESPEPAASGLSPTAAGAWFFMAILLVVVVGGPVFWWRTQFAHVPKPESEHQQKARLQSEAEGQMLTEATNAIVGLNRIIRASVVDADDNPYKWTGDVTAEFVNHVGGVERTNIFFKFRTDTGSDGLVHLRCTVETEAERRIRQRR